ncbi:MAG TPA: tetratricopeptide repeat protein [Nitrospirota bacterium]
MKEKSKTMKLIRRSLIFIVVLVIPSLSAGPAFSQYAEQNTDARHVREGMAQLKSGDYRAAQDSFESAVRYYDSGIEAHAGLGMVYYNQREDRSAERELKRVVELDPRNAGAYEVLGEISYRNDDLETAISYWETAVTLDPSAARLRERLERVRKEHRTEKDFSRDVTSHFLTKYEGREKIEAGRIILRILEDAYAEVGRALSFYPDREIQVILYSGEQFREVTDAPGWSAGIYDGKIRIPVGGVEQETPGLRRILYHEYTHAVVRTLTPRCPTWLNEGLAQYFEGREVDSRQWSALRRSAREGRLPSLSSLEGSFTGLGADRAAHTYLVSLSAVRYMIDSFGLYRVRYVLDELASGADAGKALAAGLALSSEEFERGWKKSLE